MNREWLAQGGLVRPKNKFKFPNAIVMFVFQMKLAVLDQLQIPTNTKFLILSSLTRSESKNKTVNKIICGKSDIAFQPPDLGVITRL